MVDHDALIHSFSHLNDFPRSDEALKILKRVASKVKPLMRKRGWQVGELTEFYPEENLLGLNHDHGRKICLALRYRGDRTQFFPLEEVVDTMLHELAHNIYGPHDDAFHALWDELRDEYESLLMKGYTGEGFLSKGRLLGGSRIPRHEARRLARLEAEKRRAERAKAGYRLDGSSQRLGGRPPRSSQDMRRTIASAAEKRIRSLQSCANENQTPENIRKIAATASRNGFKTQAEEDAANEVAIAEAFMELVEEEGQAERNTAYNPPRAGTPNKGESSAAEKEGRNYPNTAWTCNVCTLINPKHSLRCDACDTERSPKATQKTAEGSSNRQRTTIDLTSPGPKTTRPASSLAGPRRSATSSAAPSTPVSRTWRCHNCGQTVDHQWWSCDSCGSIKTVS